MSRAIFNSLGSNYNFSYAMRALFGGGNENKVEKILEEKYSGKPILFYKGREAIEFILKSLNLPVGSKVAINGFTCLAVYNAVKNAGLTPLPIDIEKGKLNFSAEDLSSALDKNSNIRSVIVQNTLGFPCDISNISRVCKAKKLPLIEDLAHSIGLKYENGAEMGSVGDFVALSFSQDKMIDAVTGGAAIFRDEVKPSSVSYSLTLVLQRYVLRTYPINSLIIRSTYKAGFGKMFHTVLKKLRLMPRPVLDQGQGFQKLPKLSSNLAASEFNSLGENIKHRGKICRVYEEIIDNSLKFEKSSGPKIRYPIMIENREKALLSLKKNGIYLADIWYDAPIAPKKYANKIDYEKGSCPNAEEVSGKILNLPTHKNISEEEAKKIAKIINEAK